MNLIAALCLSAMAVPLGESPYQLVRVSHDYRYPLYHYTVQVTLASTDLQNGGWPVDFDAVRFYAGQGTTQPLDFWKADEQPGVSATYWIRVPVLLPGENWLSYTVISPSPGPYVPTSYSARLRAYDGTHLDLQTDPPNKETTHPTVVVADGWMTKLSPEDPGSVTRVLVDTMLPFDPSPYQASDQLENPELWLSTDDGYTWSWPPGIGTNPAWQYQNNWLCGTPPGSGAFNSDPDAIFLRANSLPGGGPPSDTLRVYHRTSFGGQTQMVYIDLTTTDGSWGGVQISAYNSTNLQSTAHGHPMLISPAVVQEADGSLRMWVGDWPVNPGPIAMWEYQSQDGINFSMVGSVNLGLPPNLWGPWHLDVIKAGGAYYLTGMFLSFIPTTMYMLRSEDGLNFTLQLPSTLEPAPLGNWFQTGVYRPSMLYVPGSGLEFYVGENATKSTSPGYGGVGRWVDPDWTPDQPRPVTEAITTVFWGSARDFLTDPAVWPHPWYPFSNVGYSTHIQQSGSLMTLSADSPVNNHAAMLTRNWIQTTREFYAKLKMAPNCFAKWEFYSAYSPQLDTSNWGLPPKGASMYWGSTTTPVAGPVPYGDTNQFHQLRLRRIGNTGRIWWDGTELPGDPFSMSGPLDTRSQTFWELHRAGGNALTVDWYFWRDPIDPEPAVQLYYPHCTAQILVDLNCDGNVDDADVTLFTQCVTGPGIVQLVPDCQFADFDQDTDVDLDDFGILQRCLSTPLDPGCMQL